MNWTIVGIVIIVYIVLGGLISLGSYLYDKEDYTIGIVITMTLVGVPLILLGAVLLLGEKIRKMKK